MEFDWSVIAGALPALLQGAKLTVFITVAGLVGGVLVGLLFGLMRAYGNRLVSTIGFLYVEFVRGTPIVVQVMFIYFAMPVLLEIRVDAMTAAVTSIIVNSGAYIAEIVRGAFLSVPRGLREAGLALGLPTWRVLAFVVGPVAFRRMTPPLGNQFIVSLKDTSLFIVIGVGELTRQGQEIMAANFRAVEIWSAVAVIYLCLIGVLTLGPAHGREEGCESYEAWSNSPTSPSASASTVVLDRVSLQHRAGRGGRLDRSLGVGQVHAASLHQRAGADQWRRPERRTASACAAARPRCGRSARKPAWCSSSSTCFRR